MKVSLNPTSDTYDSLVFAFKFMNEKLFNGTLPICLITLQREKKTFGYFCSDRFEFDGDPSKKTDEIALNPQFFRSTGRDDRRVISTLVHEMCHMWQHHYGKPGRGRYHNAEWGDKMKSFGLPPSSTGEPGGKETGDHVSHYIEENGEFARAFEELIIQGFGLQWIEQPEIVESTVNLPGISNKKSSGSSRGDLSDDDSINDNDDSGKIITIPMPDKSNRLKYTCKGCNLNAWAKPGANLICGDCDQPMLFLT